MAVPEAHSGRIRFDPTVTIGHLVIAFVFSITSTSSVMVAYASLRQTDALLAQRITSLESVVAENADQDGRIIRLETLLDGISASVARIELTLDRMEQGSVP